MAISKNTTLSQNYSKMASFSKFEVKKNDILVGNNQPYGSVTIEQTKEGIMYPNVQAAIDDMVALYTLPINTIITNTDGISPGGISQVDSFNFDGTVSYNGLPNGTSVKFNFFGFYTDVLVGDTADEVASKVKIQLGIAASQGLVFDSVENGQTLDVLQIRYNDTQDHYLEEFTELGITVTPSTLSPAKNGYGSWSRIGTEKKTLDGSSGEITIYYFKRDN